MTALEFITKKFNIKENSLSPIEFPLFGRDEMATMFGELGFKIGAEVGVCDGTYSEILCKNNPGVKLYGIDPWEHYEGYRDYADPKMFEKMIISTKEKLSPYDFTIIKKYSMDALNDFEDNSLDFVYIDANHEDPYVTDDIKGWYKKVKVGGILSGHDYADVRLNRSDGVKWAVKDAVKKFTYENNIKPWFITGIDAPLVRRADTRRSWIIIKYI